MLTSNPLMPLLASYSEGCRIAAEHGPVSEMVYEYACDNRARGTGVVGRWLDRGFLNLTGASLLRRRVDAKIALLTSMIAARQRDGAAHTTVLDVASGTGRPLREVSRGDYQRVLTIVCHDRDPRKVMQGREFVTRDGIENLTFAVGDATDPASYLIVDEPHIVVACGLFPRLLRDDAVRTVLRLAFEHMAPSGKFACTTTRVRDRATSRWDGPYPPKTVDRAPDEVAGWLRATGFIDPRTHINEIGDHILVATKPGFE